MLRKLFIWLFVFAVMFVVGYLGAGPTDIILMGLITNGILRLIWKPRVVEE